VFARHKDKEPGLATFEKPAVESARSFITMHDMVTRAAAERLQEHGNGKTKIDELLKKERIWAAKLSIDIPGLNPADFGDNPDVPDDVLSDGDKLIEIGTNHRDLNGEPLPYAELLVQDLGAAIEEAKTEWDEAEGVQGGYRTLRAQCREAAAAFEKGLIAFRRALKAVIGRAHPDFQKLRVERARTRDVDDDEGAKALPYDDEDEAMAEEPVTPPIDGQPTGEAQVSP
jgi:hypothetical protein